MLKSIARTLATFGFSTALAFALLGCAASLCEESPRRAGGSAERTTTVVLLPETQRVLPFVVRSTPLAAAVERLGRVLGHSVELQVDRALVPPDRAPFAHALAAALDNAALALEDEQRVRRLVFAHTAPFLRVIAFRGGAISGDVRSYLDKAAGTLEVRLPGARFEPSAVRHALEHAHSAWLVRRFTAVAHEHAATDDHGFDLDFGAPTGPDGNGTLSTQAPPVLGTRLPRAVR